MTWDAAKTEMLRVLHDSKLTFSQIATTINNCFGSRFSRNACIGKAARMKLAGRAPDGNRAARQSVVPRPYVPRKQPQKKIEPSQIPTSFTVTIMQLEPWMCRYVEGEGPFFYCGQPAFNYVDNTGTEKQSAYCAMHHEVCHVQSNYQRVRTQSGSPLSGGSGAADVPAGHAPGHAH
jgi:hypothetical protein